MEGLDHHFVVGEAEQGLLVVDHGFQDHLPAPKLVQVLEGLLGVFQLKVSSVVVMP